MTPASDASHVWRFFRAGGLDQVSLDDDGDLINLERLDPKLWVALSCPTKGLEFDAHTLQLLDTDKDGRIRPPEVLAAIRWTAARLKSISSITAGRRAMPLADIDQSSPDGKKIHTAALRLLQSLKKEDANEISAADTKDTDGLLAETLLNGDGIVPSAAARTPLAAQAIEDAIAVVGSVRMRAGNRASPSSSSMRSSIEVTAYVAWCTEGDSLRAGALKDRCVESEGLLLVHGAAGQARRTLHPPAHGGVRAAHRGSAQRERCRVRRARDEGPHHLH